MSEYKLNDADNTIEIKLRISEQLLKDLCQSAKRNGRSSQVDLRLRLARSLERESEEQENFEQIATAFPERTKVQMNLGGKLV